MSEPYNDEAYEEHLPDPKFEETGDYSEFHGGLSEHTRVVPIPERSAYSLWVLWSKEGIEVTAQNLLDIAAYVERNRSQLEFEARELQLAEYQHRLAGEQHQNEKDLREARIEAQAGGPEDFD